jgi:hypothetical protein
MALALDRYLAKNPTAASIARSEGTMTADWAEAVVDSVSNVKRRRDDAPRDGSSGGSGQGSSGVGNIGVSRGMFQALEDVQATPEYIRQRRSLIKLFMSMGTTAAADRTALLEQTLTGKTPVELLPPIGAERDTVIADESKATPIPLFHQMVIGQRYNPATIDSELHFLSSLTDVELLGTLLGRVAARAYWNRPEPMPACLANLQLTNLAKAIRGKAWGNELDLVKMLDVPVLKAYHNMDAVTPPYNMSDILRLWRVAEPAIKIFEMFGFTDHTAGVSVRSMLIAPMQLSRLFVPTSQFKHEAIAKHTNAYIQASNAEACQVYHSVLSSASPNVKFETRWEQKGSPAKATFDQFYDEIVGNAAHERAALLSSGGAGLLLQVPFSSHASGAFMAISASTGSAMERASTLNSAANAAAMQGVLSQSPQSTLLNDMTQLNSGYTIYISFVAKAGQPRVHVSVGAQKLALNVKKLFMEHTPASLDFTQGYTHVCPHGIFEHGCMCEGIPGHSHAQHAAIRLAFKEIAKAKGSNVATLRCHLVGKPDLA